MIFLIIPQKSILHPLVGKSICSEMLIKVSRIIQAISSEVGLELLPSCPQILALATFSFQQKAEFRKWILYETVDPPPDKNSV